MQNLIAKKNRNKYCYSCVNATEKCFKNEIGCPCDKYKSYKDENAELNEKLLEQKQYTAFKCNEFMKKKEVYEKEHFFLNKAKEIIRNFLSVAIDYIDKEDKNYSFIAEAEQFISKVEK